MGALLRRLWTDPAYFTRILMTSTRLGLIGAGMALEAGVIPTFVDNGGKHLGPILTFLSAFVGRVTVTDARAQEP